MAVRYDGTARPVHARWLPSRLIPHRHRPRAELQPAYELQVDTLRKPREQRRPMAREPSRLLKKQMTTALLFSPRHAGGPRTERSDAALASSAAEHRPGGLALRSRSSSQAAHPVWAVRFRMRTKL